MAQQKKSVKKITKEILKKLAETTEPVIKTLEEVIVPIGCEVISVFGKTERTSFTPRSERMGEESPSYEGGDVSYLELGVKTDTPVRKIIFRGSASIRVGDKIIAYVVKGEERKRFITIERPRYHRREEVCYADRELKEEEKSVRIERVGGARENYVSVGCPASMRQ